MTWGEIILGAICLVVFIVWLLTLRHAFWVKHK